MTAFKNPITLVLSRTLSTALVVTAIFSTPLQARESRAAGRHAEQSVGVIAPRIGGERWFAAPHGPAPAPSDQPGGICDRGDDPMIC